MVTKKNKLEKYLERWNEITLLEDVNEKEKKVLEFINDMQGKSDPEYTELFTKAHNYYFNEFTLYRNLN